MMIVRLADSKIEEIEIEVTALGGAGTAEGEARPRVAF